MGNQPRFLVVKKQLNLRDILLVHYILLLYYLLIHCPLSISSPFLSLIFSANFVFHIIYLPCVNTIIIFLIVIPKRKSNCIICLMGQKENWRTCIEQSHNGIALYFLIPLLQSFRHSDKVPWSGGVKLPASVFEDRNYTLFLCSSGWKLIKRNISLLNMLSMFQIFQTCS